MGEFIRTTAINKIASMKKRIRVIPGGTYAGKTYAIIPLLINRAMSEPGIKITVVAETIDAVRNGAVEIFQQIMQDTHRWDEKKWIQNPFVYKFVNGSRMQFKAFDTVGKSKAAGKRDILFINEANHIHWEIADTLITRSDEVYLDFNPDNPFWVHKEILTLPTSEECVLTYLDNEALSSDKFEDLMLKKSKAFHNIHGSVDDDKNIKDSYWANWWKVYGLGRIGNLQGTIFNNWQTIKTIPAEAKLIGIGLDFGFAGDEAACIAVYKMDGNIYLDEIIYERGLDNPALSKLIKAAGLNCEVVADSSEPKSIEELRRMGVWISGAEKGPDSIIFGIKKLNEFNIFIKDSSTNVIEEFSRYIWARDKNGNTTGKPIDRWNHAIDAVRYLVTKKLFAQSTGKFEVSRR